MTPSSPPLPLCSGRGSAREAAAKRGAGPFDDHPESCSHAPACGTAPSLFPKSKAHPVQIPDIHRTGCHNSRFAVKPTQTCRLDPPAFFLFHRARRIFFLMPQKENGGCIPPHPRGDTKITSPELVRGGFFRVFYFAALAALMASISSGVTLNRSPQMP